MNDRLSPAQRRTIAERRQPKRHAMDRLKERHMPGFGDDEAELMVDVMSDLCAFRTTLGTNIPTVRLVNEESETSLILDLDMFEDRKTIRVCYDPISKLIRTVLP